MIIKQQVTTLLRGPACTDVKLQISLAHTWFAVAARETEQIRTVIFNRSDTGIRLYHISTFNQYTDTRMHRGGERKRHTHICLPLPLVLLLRLLPDAVRITQVPLLRRIIGLG